MTSRIQEPTTRPGGPDIRPSVTGVGKTMPMTAASIHRSTARSVSIAFRLSREDRETLRQRAADAGLTTQAYLEWKALDRVNPEQLIGGRPAQNQETLPLTG